LTEINLSFTVKEEILYDGFGNTCKKVLDLIQGQRNFQVKMQLNLKWEPREIKREHRQSVPFYGATTSPHEFPGSGFSLPKMDSPSSPGLYVPVLKELCSSLEKFMNVLVQNFII